jgi:hypothetical protein
MAGVESHADYIHVSPLAFTRPPMVLSRWYVWIFIGVVCGLVGTLLVCHDIEKFLHAPADERRVFFAPFVVGATMFLPALLFRRLTDATAA